MWILRCMLDHFHSIVRGFEPSAICRIWLKGQTTRKLWKKDCAFGDAIGHCRWGHHPGNIHLHFGHFGLLHFSSILEDKEFWVLPVESYGTYIYIYVHGDIHRESEMYTLDSCNSICISGMYLEGSRPWLFILSSEVSSMSCLSRCRWGFPHLLGEGDGHKPRNGKYGVDGAALCASTGLCFPDSGVGLVPHLLWIIFWWLLGWSQSIQSTWPGGESKKNSLDLFECDSEEQGSTM